MKLPHRRQFLHLAAGAAALLALSRIARAQAYPSRPVRIIVPFPPGGPYDIHARLMGQWLSERFSQPFVIENRSGAGGNVGTETVVRASPDGYTLLLVGLGAAINATLYEKLNFNFMRDIAPGCSDRSRAQRHGSESLVSRQDRSGVHSLCKGQSKQDQHGIGRQRNGSPCHRRVVQDEDRHQHDSRALSGFTPALTDLIGGQVQVTFDPLPSSIEHIKAGKLRALAVTTVARSDVLPDVPTVGDFVPGFEASAWYGVGAPRNMPSEIVDRLNKEINAALADPKLKGRLSDVGSIPTSMTPAEFGTFVADETEKWGKVIRAANIKAE